MTLLVERGCRRKEREKGREEWGSKVIGVVGEVF